MVSGCDSPEPPAETGLVHKITDGCAYITDRPHGPCWNQVVDLLVSSTSNYAIPAVQFTNRWNYTTAVETQECTMGHGYRPLSSHSSQREGRWECSSRAFHAPS